MLNTTLKQQYLQSMHKVILPEDAGMDHRALAATIAANFESLTFRLPPDAIRQLSYASKEDIIAFYQTYQPVLEKMTGADHVYHPFYPNFPQDVMDRDRVEIFFDQVLYGITNFELRPEIYETVTARFPYMGHTVSHPLSVGSEEDYRNEMQHLMKSPTAYSPQQIQDLKLFFREYPKAEQYAPSAEAVKNHENRVIIACMMMDYGAPGHAVKAMLTDVNDILKFAAVRSAQIDYLKGKGRIAELQMHGKVFEAEDFYHYASLRYDKNQAPSYQLFRKTRQLIVQALEANAKQYGADSLPKEMMNHKAEWKRVIHNLHIGDFRGQASATEAAFQAISTNQPIERHTRTIEEAIKQNDLPAALAAAEKKPGDFIRRTDKFLQMGMQQGNVTPVIDTLRTVAPQASISTLLSLASHIQQRTQPQEMRTFHIAATSRTHRQAETRQPIAPVIADMVENACKDGMRQQFAGKELFETEQPKVYISPKSADYKTPNDIRGLSIGTHTYTPGSKIDISSPSDLKRLFVWWTNTKKDRVDIDLAVEFYDSQGNQIARVGWNDSYQVQNENGQIAAVYSGDVRDGGEPDGPGSAEFVDLDCKVLREMGVASIVPTISSYCSEPFAEMEHISFGYMDRDTITPNHMDGELFEASTVETRMDLNANATAVLPCIFTLNPIREQEKGNEQMEMLWMDMAYQGRVASMDTIFIENLHTVAAQKAALSVADLLQLNAEAHGAVIVTDPKQADFLCMTEKEEEQYRKLFPEADFSDKTIIHPDDLHYVVSRLMPTAAEFKTEAPDKAKEPEPEIEKETAKPEADLYAEYGDLLAEAEEQEPAHDREDWMR